MRLKQHVNEHKGTWLLFRFEINTTIVVLVVKPKKGNRCTTTTTMTTTAKCGRRCLIYIYVYYAYDISLLCVLCILFCTCFILLVPRATGKRPAKQVHWLYNVHTAKFTCSRRRRRRHICHRARGSPVNKKYGNLWLQRGLVCGCM